MKRLTLFALALLVLLSILPTLAQDTPVSTAEATVESPVVITTGEDGSVDITVEAPDPTPPSDTTSPFVYLAYGGIVVVVVALLFNLPALLKIVAPLIPAETALELAKGMIPSASETVLNNYAAKTPTPLDETLLILALEKLGYKVTKDEGGFHTTPPTNTPPTA